MFRIEIINLKGLLDSLGAASRQVDDEFLNLESAKQLLRELKVTVEEREKFFLPKPESLEVETKRANELGAKRKQLETALRKSEMFYGYGSDSQELKRELDLISTELIRQTSLVRGLMGLPKLDGRSFATDAYLRGHFFGQTYPRQLLEISRQKAKVQKLRMKVRESQRRKRSIEAELTRESASLEQKLRMLTNPRKVVGLRLKSIAAPVEKALQSWQLQELSPGEEDVLEYVERRARGKGILKNYLMALMEEKHASWAALRSALQDEVAPPLEGDAIADFLIFLRKTQHDLFSTLLELLTESPQKD